MSIPEYVEYCATKGTDPFGLFVPMQMTKCSPSSTWNRIEAIVASTHYDRIQPSSPSMNRASNPITTAPTTTDHRQHSSSNHHSSNASVLHALNGQANNHVSSKQVSPANNATPQQQLPCIIISSSSSSCPSGATASSPARVPGSSLSNIVHRSSSCRQPKQRVCPAPGGGQAAKRKDGKLRQARSLPQNAIFSTTTTMMGDKPSAAATASATSHQNGGQSRAQANNVSHRFVLHTSSSEPCNRAPAKSPLATDATYTFEPEVALTIIVTQNDDDDAPRENNVAQDSLVRSTSTESDDVTTVTDDVPLFDDDFGDNLSDSTSEDDQDLAMAHCEQIGCGHAEGQHHQSVCNYNNTDDCDQDDNDGDPRKLSRPTSLTPTGDNQAEAATGTASASTTALADRLLITPRPPEFSISPADSLSKASSSECFSAYDHHQQTPQHQISQQKPPHSPSSLSVNMLYCKS